MKLVAILCIVLLVVSDGLSYAAFYWLGYSETLTALEATDPLSLLLFDVILFLILMAIMLWSLRLRKHRVWMTCAMIVYLALFFIPWRVLPAHGSLIVYGLRDRMIRDYGIDDLRHFARDTSQVLQDEYLDHGDAMFFSADKLAAYSKLKQKYAFLNWTGDGSHGPSVYNRDGAVSIDWGGPFGHWGFSVAVDGGKNDPAPDPEFFVIRVSDDIYFYMD